MNTLAENSVIVMGFAVSFAMLASSIWVYRQFFHQGKVFLSLILVIWGIFLLATTILFAPLDTSIQALIYRVGMPLYFAMPALVYFYVNSLIFPDFIWKPRYYLHFLPVLVVVIDLLPYYNLPFEQKISYLETLKLDINKIFEGRDGYLRSDVREAMLVLQLIVYVFVTWANLTTLNKNQWKVPFPVIKWSIFLGVVITVVMGMKLIFLGLLQINLGGGELRAVFAQVIVASTLLFLVFFAFLAFHFKSLKYAHEVEPTTEEEGEEPIAFEESIVIDPELLAIFENKIFQTQPYLKAKYTLAEFAHDMQLPTYQISQLLKYHYKTNFNDFINGLRIKEVKKHLEGDDFQNYSIEGIAKDCGFAAKSTFFTAFKKHTGLTPMEYQKLIQKNKQQA